MQECHSYLDGTTGSNSEKSARIGCTRHGVPFDLAVSCVQITTYALPRSLKPNGYGGHMKSLTTMYAWCSTIPEKSLRKCNRLVLELYAKQITEIARIHRQSNKKGADFIRPFLICACFDVCSLCALFVHPPTGQSSYRWQFL